MPVYQEKPVLFKACQWDGTEECFHVIAEELELIKDATNAYKDSADNILFIDSNNILKIQVSPKVVVCVLQGDYVIKRPINNLLAVSPKDFFENEYQEVKS